MPKGLRAGIETTWISRGAGRQPALFIHCTLASARSFAPVMDTLGDFLSSTAFDLPGHGDSAAWDRSGDYLGRATDVAETFLDGPADIVGHSFGAVVALSLMTRRPDLVRRAVLIEPVLFAAARGTAAFDLHDADHEELRSALREGDRERATARFVAIWGDGTSWSDMPPVHRRTMISRIHLVEAASPGLLEDSMGILRGRCLDRLEAPTLLVRGEETHSVIPAIFKSLRDRLPNAVEEAVPAAGHMAPVTHPSAVSALIRQHLAGAERPGP